MGATRAAARASSAGAVPAVANSSGEDGARNVGDFDSVGCSGVSSGSNARVAGNEGGAWLRATMVESFYKRASAPDWVQTIVPSTQATPTTPEWMTLS
jgi:hypothetical protein